MQTAFELPPYPSGWYLVCLTEKLKPGVIISEKFCGEDVVIFRTASGEPVMMGAYCPHMGAHFAHGGKVEGESIQCPFHGFCFDKTGACVKTGYGTKPPPQAVVKTWHLREQNGLILAFHHPDGIAPDWEIPVHDEEGWSETRFKEWKIESHPQEIAENSVDFGHFSLVHGYEEVKEFESPRADGPYLKGRYGMARIANFVGKGGRKVHAEFNFTQFGVGYAFVEAQVVEFGLKSRHYVFPTPIDGKQIHLRIATSVNLGYQPKNIHPLLAVIPKFILTPFLLAGYYREYQKDVSDDFKIWKNKIYVHPPALAKGDGPVILYRKWAEQFYPGGLGIPKREKGVLVGQ
ncbi:MAG: Rieske 2Fe-2S domain-containing protein [Bacteroidia bacterium]|nr:Rieske 2Fe-2S domain-containing protein [Bacteroidia bacterium]